MTTDNKTLAVDVLAVLRQIADGEGDAQVLAMRAHVAVAELIEAAGAYHRARNIQQRVDSSTRLVAALARVKGESA